MSVGRQFEDLFEFNVENMCSIVSANQWVNGD